MAAEYRYDGQVAVVTGAGNGLGKQYALFYASRGAKVVVNDLGGTFNGKAGASSAVADVVVQQIKDAGGEAVPNYDSVQNGDRIIKTAIDAWGRVDILINNAGILRDITLRNMKDEDWDVIIDIHVNGAMKTARAAWPVFRKQRYGKVINTSSSSGLFGNFGQSNYAAAKMALIGFTETLAKEGAKYNIHCNALAPGAASRLTQTVWPPEMMEVMKPDYVVPLVGVLTHPSCSETGSIFEGAAGHFSKIRWERSQGFLARPDDSLTADLILRCHDRIVDYTGAEHPQSVADSMALLEKAMAEPPSPRGEALNFKGRVALVTGGGDGLGRAYAIQFARLGAKVVVCDLKNADKVAEEIRGMKGDATALSMSVEEGEAVVNETIKAYGRIDIVVNNAGILRDKAFQNMTDELWYPVMNVHLRGTYKVTRAAWPHFLKQKYGRVVNVTSTSGIYGNFGQSNYAAAAFAQICDFDNGQADNPDNPQEGSRYTMGNVMKNPKFAKLLQPEDRSNRKYLSKIDAALKLKGTPTTYTYSDRDVILYNLGVGAKRTDLPLVFEGADNFMVLPTFGVVPTYHSSAPYELKDIIPNYDQRMLLHGEQYLEIKAWPIPTSGTLKSSTHLVEVVDKGNAALVRRGNTTTDASGKEIFYNESVSFIRGSGGFGGAKKPSDRGAATAANDPPNRSPDKVVEEKTSPDLAALYRLMGDYNPLHLDPKFSAVGGFKEPILHGLATFGISGKHVFQTFGLYKNIKVRFSGTVLPGETIVTEMWREGNKVIYRAKVKESGKVCISNAGVELMDEKARL